MAVFACLRATLRLRDGLRAYCRTLFDFRLNLGQVVEGLYFGENEPVTQTIDGRHVITSGTLVLAPGQRSATVAVASGALRFVMSSEPGDQLRMQTAVASDGVPEIQLINFNNSLGTAANGTMTLGGVGMEWVAAVHSIGDESPFKVLSFTVLG